MIHLPQASIRFKLVLSASLASIMILMILGYLSHLWNTRAELEKIDTFLVADSSSSANALTAALTESLQNKQTKDTVMRSKDFQEFLTSFFSYRLNHPAIYKTTLAIFDPDSNLVASSNDALLISDKDIPLPSSDNGEFTQTDNETKLHTVQNGDLQYRLVVVPLRIDGLYYGQVRVACLLSSVKESIAVFDRSLLTLLVLIGILVFPGILTLTRHTLRPVRQMCLAAEKMNAQNLSNRLPLPPGKDELASLSATLNTFLTRIEEARNFQIKIVDDLSHQLRTPLTLVRGSVELALQHDLSFMDREKIMENCLVDIDRMSAFLGTMLSLARLESRSIQLQLATTDMVVFLTDQLSDMEPLWKAQGQKVFFIVSKDQITEEICLDDPEAKLNTLPAIEIPVDKVMFGHAFMNLMENAFKYCSQKGIIKVTLDYDTGKLPTCIHIFNNGPPIAEDELDRIFERFYRGKKTNRQQDSNTVLADKGFGLGLNIARSIIDLHGGSIQVVNPIGGGCQFDITLGVSG